MKIIDLFLKTNRLDKEYIKLSLKLRKMINKTIRNMPKSYRYVITNNILSLIQQITNYCLQSEYIQLTQDLSIDQFKEKQFLLDKANQILFNLKIEIVFLFEMLNEGNNVFSSAEETNKIFDKLIKTISNLSNSIHTTQQFNVKTIKKIKIPI